MDAWYFAYGSNLLAAQMIRRTGAAAEPRIAWLAGYRPAFNMSGGDGNVYANVVQPGDGVCGVLYRCSAAALAKLDGFETGYARRPISVVDLHGETITAEIYLARPERVTAERPPTAEYWERIVTGARQHGLPAEYVRSLERAAHGQPSTQAAQSSP
jgi:hypothetical protein